MGRYKKARANNIRKFNQTYRIKSDTFIKRIKVLEMIYGSQAALATSMGVDTRTIRKWKLSERTISKQSYQKINRRYNYWRRGSFTSKYTYEFVGIIESSYLILHNVTFIAKTQQKAFQICESILSTRNIMNDYYYCCKQSLLNDSDLEKAFEYIDLIIEDGNYSHLLISLFILKSFYERNKKQFPGYTEKKFNKKLEYYYKKGDPYYSGD